MSDRSETEWIGRNSGKDALRDEIWSLLKQQGVAPIEPFGHIPSFVGAEAAAEQLAALPIWRSAQVIKCNPDTAQVPVRLRALRDGKRLYMAVPRLAELRCFIELTADALRQRGVDPAAAATAVGALAHGRPVALQEMSPIDLVVTGCVAVTRDGGRTGKGAGFADLELGMLRRFGLLQPGTPIVTTVHPLQIVDGPRLPMLPHDSALDWIVTPDEAIETRTPYPQPAGLDWDAVLPDQIDAIPVLRHLRERQETRDKRQETRD
ncbi:MAG: 5-formyltetrahydrofolate cyclo-ligase [Roseiflexaceae bacterium]